MVSSVVEGENDGDCYIVLLLLLLRLLLLLVALLVVTVVLALLVVTLSCVAGGDGIFVLIDGMDDGRGKVVLSLVLLLV